MSTKSTGTTIAVDNETKSRLNAVEFIAYGRTGENVSYDKLLNDLIDTYNNHEADADIDELVVVEEVS